jgi:pullulanase
MATTLLERKQTHFVLWRPGPGEPAPKLIIGVAKVVAGRPPEVLDERRVVMTPVGETDDLWELAAAELRLREGQVYHYWFEVPDTAPFRAAGQSLRCTDPAAASVDWRVTANSGDAVAPAGVVRWRGGRLVPSDAEDEPVLFDAAGGAEAHDTAMAELPPNNKLVIYELPTAWTKTGDLLDRENVGTGTFRDVRALIEGRPARRRGRFHRLHLFDHGHLIELGVNALELLPPADTFADRGSWGYATSNYFAPDFDLGRALDADEPAAVNDARPSTAVGDLLDLVRSCHRHGIRFFYDAVMAFGNHDPYRAAAFLDYHVFFNQGDPEQGNRDGFGGDLWKYALLQRSYDPVTGTAGTLVRARRHMITHLLHWMRQYHIDGVRLDSVNNYGNWDFAGDVRRETRAVWHERWRAEGNPADDAAADARFLVVGEELTVPKGLLGRVDGLWNEEWKWLLRRVILGGSGDGLSFEESVRRLIDCRPMGFADLTQAVNYVGSHDVGGAGNERLFTFLKFAGLPPGEAARRVKLAFVCLLTSVGIPMILAGDEFADEHDIDIFNGERDGHTPDTNKQLDPVNFERLDDDPVRQDVFHCVSRLVHLRTGADALSVNDTTFIHADFDDGKRVLAWQRGRRGVDEPVVVVANFSAWGTDDPTSPAAEYVVPGWPAVAPGRRWREVTRDRLVDPARVGREALFPWEAKVYALE